MRSYEELEHDYIGDLAENSRPFAVIRVVGGRVVAVEGGGGLELYVIADDEGGEYTFEWPETQPGSYVG